MVKSEYRELEIQTTGSSGPAGSLPEDCLSELDRLGKEGWEVDHVVQMQATLGGTGYVSLILRRKLE